MKRIKIKRKKSEIPVQNGLALTPARMDLMRREGVPIASNLQPVESYTEGDTSPSYFVPLEHRRGVDMARIWDESLTAKRRIDSKIDIDYNSK